MARTFVSFGLGVVLMSVLTMSLPARAASVGEVHRVASEPTAATRDEGHRAELRITIWYPASTDAVEAPLIIGPPAAPEQKSIQLAGFGSAGKTQTTEIVSLTRSLRRPLTIKRKL
jgi:hypothetical protein